ncbi:Bifunctional protein GlmU [Neomoorella glycerini]|uniref:Bifunctional protein GlmU n=1 Tax=Neomoorella glycerini TaxID=55779 RepID=A0A6I5ZT32_9FIRM|nr:nucleotidyltransferase family protein [Moorella glycerini]QGP92819.1 Bifunctional protein GlmU [Moorella glycerini]
MGWHDDKLKDIWALPGESLKLALPRMDRAGLQVLLVGDTERHLLGIITDGDIRRALLRGESLDIPVEQVMQARPRVLLAGVPLDAARRLMLSHNIRHIPLVNNEHQVVDLLLWIDLFGGKVEARPEPVVIMAGGKGTRLDPFTKILPKPMIPLGDKPIVEVLMDRFYDQGFSQFILSVGYKAEVVKLYFNDSNGRPYKVNFVQEEEPLGTAGALGLLRQQLQGTFLVTNCDVIIEMNYGELLRYHQEKGNALTIVGALRDFTIPYGVLRTEAGEFHQIEEKPSFHFLVNTGLYVLEPEILEGLDNSSFIHMTDLIMATKDKGLRVGVYPHHGRWFDIGQWDEYRQTLRAFDGLI